MDRRQFLVRTGFALSSTLLGTAVPLQRLTAASSPGLETWDAVRAQFPLAADIIHMSCFFLASHPRPVREAIARHRQGLDENPIGYWMGHGDRLEADVLRAAADYLGVRPEDIALTDSTTMGLGLLYNGLALGSGQEILTTVHDHYSTEMSLRLRAERTGATVRQISLYGDPAELSADEVVGRLRQAIRPQTRYVAITWVHSSTGVKLPIRPIADMLRLENGRRSATDRVLLCVDGVHGLGVEDVRLEDLGCDFFIAGTHKWLFGPRGTGVVWGHPDAWPRAHAIIPTFSHEAYRNWMGASPPQRVPYGAIMTPGGFHSFEHRWALGEAFRFHQAIGTARVMERIHALNEQLKEGLATLRHVRLITPRRRSLSAGIVCFEIDGWSAQEAVEHLIARRIMASVTPYAVQYVRLAPGLVTSSDEVEQTLRVIRSMNR